MKAKEFYDQVMGEADTRGTHINAAEVSRVLHVAFLELNRMAPVEIMDTICRCMAAAQKKEKS